MEPGLTPREVADELGVTIRTVQRWIADGRLPAQRIGSRTRVSRSSLSSVSTTGNASNVQEGQQPAKGQIRALLVANRGEIAVRIARTARRMGIRVIGVHPAGERAPDGIDEAHDIESYLDGEEMLAVAERTGADAVHPGYGFLAENAGFANAVAKAGLAWVGPPAGAIAAMGDKAAARQQAAAHGVPTVPGFDGDAQDDRTLHTEAARVGFPLLVKPSAGGGGKGMRVVHEPGDLAEALGAARREAHRSFGDDRLILERYLAGSRHVEIQVLFDAHGDGVHLGERDCSAQRRNQKIIEEAPAPSVTAELRARMGSTALTVAASVGYVNAGTVEMLLTDAGEFFFLEMNTRLQVEHPVTEAVTGRDLVEDQLRIAGGATLAELGLREPPRLTGHAIEVRLYAEDPESGFLPATGTIAALAWPEGIRVDSGIRQGDEVSDRYDPMLAKLIAHGRSRKEALERLGAALAQTTVLGVRTNLRHLRWLLDQAPMRGGQMRTDTVAALIRPTKLEAGDEHWRAAGRLLATDDDNPWTGGWRLNAPRGLRLRLGDEERNVALDGTRGVGGWVEAGPAAVRDGDVVHVDVDGQSIEFTLAPAPTVESAIRHIASDGEGTAMLTAPMPGRVIAVRVTEGAPVRAQEPVIVIEAMKMEHAVVSPMDGRLTGLNVKEGQQVQRGDVLATVRAEASPHG